MEVPHLEALHQKQTSGDVRVFVIDVNEDKKTTSEWATGHGLTFPVLLDSNGLVSASFAPVGLIPELPRDQVPIGSNLIIDREGKIQFYSLLDTKNFDAKLIALQEKLNALIAAESSQSSAGEGPKLSQVISLKKPELITLKKGNHVVAEITFTVKDGFHVLADAGKEKSLVPLQIIMTSNQRVVIGEQTYPKSEPLDLLSNDFPFGVYSGEVVITINLSANSNSDLGEGTLEGQIIYQSCDDRTCFPPDSLRVSIPIKIIE